MKYKKKSICFSFNSIHHGDRIAYIIGNDIQDVPGQDLKNNESNIEKKKQKFNLRQGYLTRFTQRETGASYKQTLITVK